MKTYKQLVEYAARKMYDRYMGGSNEYYTLDGSDMVAYVFGVSETRFHSDVTKAFEKWRDYQYAMIRG